MIYLVLLGYFLVTQLLFEVPWLLLQKINSCSFEIVVIFLAGILQISFIVFILKKVNLKWEFSNRQQLILPVSVLVILQLIIVFLSKSSDQFVSGNILINSVLILYGLILMPIIEEILFRGMFYQYFLGQHVIKALVINVVIFTVLHTANLFSWEILIYMLMGVVINLFYIKYESILKVILLRVVSNVLLISCLGLCELTTI